ncbi:MAG: hypothetical protein JWM11_1201 [Planctomycetaceae bacterium]|nr:hypothetical protein [Planctomycetaceae bacterium]
MSDEFDPYYKWLGILSKDQPPHHYRLLGLEPFEEDLQVIEGAADRQLSFLRKFQAGEHAAQCQKLLNEVSRARLCLLKPASKAAYDSELRALLHESSSPEPEDVEPSFDVETGTATIAGRRHNTLPIPAIAGGLVLLLVILGFVFLRGGGKANQQQVDLDDAGAVPVKSPDDPPVKLGKPDEPQKSATPSPRQQSVVDRQIDILPLLREEHIGKGNWQIKPDSLESLGEIPQALVRLPVAAPQEYTLHIEGVRFEGSGSQYTTMAVGIACGEQECLLAFQVHRNSGGIGLESLDGRIWNQNETWQPDIVFPVRKPFHLDVIVRKADIEARLDGRTILSWGGSFSRLGLFEAWKLAGAKQLFIAAESTYRFTKLTLGPPLPPQSLPGRELKVRESVELTKFVDLNRDVWHGAWLKDGTSLKSNQDETGMRFSVPFQMPEEYELHADIEWYLGRKEFYLGLPFQQGYAGVVLGGGEGESNGLYLDRRNFYEIPGLSQNAKHMQPGRNHLFANVRKNHLGVKVEDKTIFDWKGDPRRFLMSPLWAVPGNQLAIGTWNSGFRVSSLQLNRLAPAPSLFSAPEPPNAGDLLSVVDIDRDSSLGSWKRTPTGITSSDQLVNGLRFPAKLPKNYEFRVVVERKTKSEAFCLSVPVFGRSVMLALDSANGVCCGIEWFENRRSFENSTTIRQTELSLPIGKPCTVFGHVEGNHLRVELNGKKLWDLDIPESLTDRAWDMRPAWLTPEERLQMSAATWYSGFEILEARFRSLDQNSPAFPAINLAALKKPVTGRQGKTSATASGRPEKMTANDPDSSLVGAGSLATGTTPVPNAAAQATALKEIQKVYATEYAKSKKDSEKLLLAGKLEKLANDTHDDLATKYVSFEEARRLYIDVGDLSKLLELIDAMGIDFKLNTFELKVATLKGVAPKLKGVLLNRMFAEQALSLSDQSLQAEQYSQAGELAGLAIKAATLAKDKTLQTDAQEIRKEATALSEQEEVVQKAIETLKTQPDNSAARLVRGRWLCFSKKQWPEGLADLQGTDDKVLKELAAKDLRGPTEKDMQQLAADWLAYAKSGKDHSQAEFAERSLYWYAKAHEQATGLAKKALELPMEEAVKVRDWDSPLIPLLKLIDQKASQNKIAKSEESAFEGGDTFEEFPANRGILIGFNCSIGPYDRYRVIVGIQAVYATKLGTQAGPWHGLSNGELIEVRAKREFAVSGIRGETGGAFDILQVSFSRITRTGLDLSRTYLSPAINLQPSINLKDGGWKPKFTVPPNRQTIVGIFGHADTYLRGLGVIFSQ